MGGPEGDRGLEAPLRIGVLASQGGFGAHCRMLSGLGAEPVEVRTPADLTDLDALIIPGGESTTISMAIERDHLAEPIVELAARGRPVLGTCAGMIVCDRDHLGLLDAVARRNAFGRQLQSFEADLEIEGIGPEPLRTVFIRAPWLEDCGEGVEVLARWGRAPGRGPPGRRDRLLVPPRADRRLEDSRTVDGNGERRPRASPRRAGGAQMRDPRVDNLARIMVEHSAAVQSGDSVVIESAMAAEPLVRAVYERVLELGAHPIVNLDFDGSQATFFERATDEQIAWISPTARWVAEQSDVRIRLMASRNTRELSGVDPSRQTLRQKAMAPLMASMMQTSGERRAPLGADPVSRPRPTPQARR